MRGGRAWLPAAVGVDALGIAAIVAFGYRNLVIVPFDSWLDFVGVGIWALVPWWITAGIATRMGWGPREIATHDPISHPSVVARTAPKLAS